MLKIKNRMEQDPYQVAEVVEECNIAEDSALNEAMLMACQEFEKKSSLFRRLKHSLGEVQGALEPFISQIERRMANVPYIIPSHYQRVAKYIHIFLFFSFSFSFCSLH